MNNAKNVNKKLKNLICNCLQQTHVALKLPTIWRPKAALMMIQSQLHTTKLLKPFY